MAKPVQSENLGSVQSSGLYAVLLLQWRQLWAVLPTSMRRSLLGLMLLSLLASSLEAVSLALVIPVTLLLMGAPVPTLPPMLSGWLGNATPHVSFTESLPAAMALLVLAFSVKAAILLLLSARQARVAFDIYTRLSCRLFEGYMQQPWLFHLQRNSAQLISTATSEVMFATNNLQAMLTLLLDVLSLIAISALLLYVEPWGSLLGILGLGGAALLLQQVTRRRILAWGKSRQTSEGSRLQCAQQALSATKEIRILGRERFFIEAFSGYTRRAGEAGRKRSALQNLPRLWVEWICVLGLALLVTMMSLQGRSGADIAATMALFAATAFRLLPILTRLLNSLQSLQFGQAAVARVVRDIAQAADVSTPVPAASCPPLPRSGEVVFDKVSFGYPGMTRLAVRDIDLHLASGAVVGIVGSTGAGKSTLVDVLLGLVPPDRGTVRVDGVDIAGNLRGWQARIGYVPQHIALIDDSVRRNVAFGLEDGDVDEALLERALSAAQLRPFIQRLPNGLDTLVGERGVRLSGGERQRIGLARALYRDPDVLVLDEATSALDHHTEAQVMDSVLALRGSKTVVLVAHRLTTVERCDWIYRLEDGVVVASGPACDVLASLRHSADTALSDPG